MKPDWKDAPEWARYLAQDMNLKWYWYEDEPYAFLDRWDVGYEAPDASRFERAEATKNNWRNTLETRPAS